MYRYIDFGTTFSTPNSTTLHEANLEGAQDRARRGTKQPFVSLGDADMLASMKLDSKEPVSNINTTQLQGESEWYI